MQTQEKKQSSLAFSVRMLWRDWRGGELRILAVALVIAVTSVTSVGFFIDRVQQGMSQQAAELIAADLVVTSPHPFEKEYAEEANKQDLITALTTQFRSVTLANDRLQLVEVKGVSQNYPLRGRLHIASAPYAAETETDMIPAHGEAWVEARLLQLLNIEVGEQIKLGNLSLKITRVLTYEPDRGGDFFSLAPRVLINQQDIAATALIQTGALVNYRLLIAGTTSNVKAYRKWLDKQLEQGEKILDLEGGRPELRTALNRSQEFLGLAALISVLLAGVAVATSARRFAQRHTDTSAILRCLGATQTTIIKVFGLEMLLLAIITSTIGCLLGWLTHLGLTQILDKLLLASLPAASLQPLILGYATGVIMLMGFALPPLLALKSVPPLRVLRKDQTGRTTSSATVYLAVILSMGILLQWQIGKPQLVLYVMGGMVLTLVVLAIAAYVLVRMLNRLRQRVGVAWRFGFANIARRPGSSVIQIVAFGLGIMVLLLLSTVRTDLLNNWQRSLPADAPNHFLINVQPDQVDGLQQFLSRQGVVSPKLYPMVRARLTGINNKEVSSDDYDGERAKHLITREFNLSWSADLQPGNTLLAGQWWNHGDKGKPLLSLESGIAKTLKINLNDTVHFNVNGSELKFQVSSLRAVDWDTFNINFFTVVPPGTLDKAPASWVTSVYLDAEQKKQLGSLVKSFPNVTVIDVDAIMKRVRTIIDRVTLAVEFIFVFSVLAGLMVLYAAIQANQDERRFESAILRTLGARRNILLRGLIAEFVTLGALAGFLAGMSATSIAYVLAEKVFHFEYTFTASTGLIGILAGIVVVGVAGVMGTYTVLSQPPLQTLREN